MKIKLSSKHSRLGAPQGGSLVEVIFSLGIATLTIAGSVNGYVLSANRAEWSAYSLAAHSLAMQRLEQVRAAKWDTAAYPAVDQIVQSNFGPQTNILDVPISCSNIVYAVSRTTMSDISANPPLKLVRVDTVWNFMNRGIFTNTVTTYRAPDQ